VFLVWPIIIDIKGMYQVPLLILSTDVQEFPNGDPALDVLACSLLVFQGVKGLLNKVRTATSIIINVLSRSSYMNGETSLFK
jgi:hypothetical protein